MRHLALSLLGLAALAAPGTSQATPLKTELAWSGYVRPLVLLPAPGDASRLFVVEQNQADIHIIVNGTQVGAPFLDLTGLVTTGGNEQGLLGLAFHPDYQSNRKLYVNYTGGGGTKIVEYLRDAVNPNVADAGSAKTILEFSQPQSNHNGGTLAFGPDGYLWIATGDGGNFNDIGTGHAPGGNAQSGETLLGKMLRIDVDGDDFPADPNRNYAIPATNPGAQNPSVRDEIIHFGLRNPWKWSFDSETGDLYIGDVGQNAREEMDFLSVDKVLASDFVNWGWNCMEGAICTPGVANPGCTCNDPGLTGPVAGWAHGTGQSLTGGFVYRGDAIPDLDGWYFFGDYQSGFLHSLVYDGATSTLVTTQQRTAELDPPGAPVISRPASFGVDADGEMYILDLLDGEIWKIVPDGPFLGLGGAYAGTNGDPVLFGTGGVGLGEAGGLHVRSAVPSSLAVGFASLTNNPVPFYGGQLVPGLPLVLALNVFTNGAGEIDLTWTDLGNNPSGLDIYIQFGFDDPGATFGVSLSNAIVATVP